MKVYFVVKDIILGHLFGQINKCLVIDTTAPKGRKIYFTTACYIVNDISFMEIWI